ncbi:hypothetical protein ACFVSQ_15890 [Streptomyces niveus]|uniref:hypothetical protein n=1 Tax=Streptomyces niveus TaxID=193462 RepID=UPI0036E4893C
MNDLRRNGFTVHADIALDPAQSATPPRPAQPNTLSERRSRIAQASAGRSPQHGDAAADSASSSVRRVPPEPGYMPTLHLRASSAGRSR